MMFEMAEIFHAIRCLFLPGCQMAASNSYALHHNFESDFLTVSKAGFVHEVEIKLSRADFQRDFNKSGYSKKLSQDGLIEIVKKHDLIKAGHLANYFWFAVPAEMIQPEEVPDHCGLIWVGRGHYNLVLQEVRKAPRLHREKCKLEHRISMLSSMAYRGWAALGKKT